MRHGQGMHNAVENGHNIRDPALTEKGRQQCRDRWDAFQRHDNVSQSDTPEQRLGEYEY